MPNYTKGEWEVYEGIAAPVVIIKGIPNRPNQIIAVCRLEKGSEGHSEALANANLIAAAPTMYETLKQVLPWAKEWIAYLRRNVGAGQGKDADAWFTKADKALAKAEGKPERTMTNDTTTPGKT